MAIGALSNLMLFDHTLFAKGKKELHELVWEASDDDSISNIEISHASDKAIGMDIANITGESDANVDQYILDGEIDTTDHDNES
eukprot:10903492-Ditylum_brightwellii.AAC.1